MSKKLICNNPVIYADKGESMWLRSLYHEGLATYQNGVYEVDWLRVRDMDVEGIRNIGAKGQLAIQEWCNRALKNLPPTQVTGKIVEVMVITCPHCGEELIVKGIDGLRREAP